MKNSSDRIETLVIHAGEPSPRIGGAVALPVFQSAIYESVGNQAYDDQRYIRLNNTPNHVALHEKLAALENAEAGLVTASGMAAITSTLLTVLKTGDHLLIQKVLYGGTHSFVTEDFAGFGLSYDFIDANDPASWKALLRPNTRAIYVEAMSNPMLEIPDLEAVVAFAREQGLLSLVDNTFPSPINFRPCDLGFDLSLHSATKYLNGHSDLVAGVVLGSQDWIRRITHRLNHLGGTLDPHACFLLHRGLKTLAVRMRQHNESAPILARLLEGHPAVSSVNYPGLPSHPQHLRAQRLFGGFSGMLSFELKGGQSAAERFLSAVRLPIVAPSLGGVETLITRPANTSHAGISPADRLSLGITDSLIRLSVGIEATDDLERDLSQALALVESVSTKA